METMNRLAFDCGSSGSNVLFTTATEACLKSIETARLNPELKVLLKNVDKISAKNNKKPEDGELQSGCTVSTAFYAGAYPTESCEIHWQKVATWAKSMGTACTATCWGAGTAGNRLVSQERDVTSWANFQKWLGANGICSAWMTQEAYTSQKGSLTIPGTMEAAMEVETIIDRGDIKAIAFGSAGGSSAQFGVKLREKNSPTPTDAEKGWDALVAANAETFKCANFHSSVDSMSGDYLNTYTASDGSKWGVGSFLGSDSCLPDKYMVAASPNTPIGGMSAMECGLKKALNVEDFSGTSAEQMMEAMANSPQGQFAMALKNFMAEHYFAELESVANIRFIASTFSVIHNRDTKVIGFRGKSLTSDMFVKLGWAYMSTIGLAPRDLQKLVKEEVDSNDKEGILQNDEYAWLDAAADVGFGKIQGGQFAKPLSPGAMTEPACAPAIAPMPEPMPKPMPGYMKPTISSQAKVVGR